MDRNMRITGIKPMTLALFEGTLGLSLGIALAVAVFVESAALQTALTSSFLSGLSFGLSASLLTLLIVPVLYFVIGLIVGYLHALLFNAVAAGSKRMVIKFKTETNRSTDRPAMPLTPRQRAMGFGERLPERRRRVHGHRR
jgi:H+/Cl- antiporter ClcA